MALKAGRVGVAPSQVDAAGNIIGGGSGSDSYTKAEADAKFATKAQLTANEKEFNFAYDATTQKYGYKAGATGEFHPFDNAGSGIGIMVDDPITEGIVLPSGVTLESGGFEIDVESNTALIGMYLRNTTGGEVEVEMPFIATSSVNKSCLVRLVKSTAFDLPNYNSIYLVSTGTSAQTGNTILFLSGTYIYVIGWIRLNSAVSKNRSSKKSE